jgi:hypothetical protein
MKLKYNKLWCSFLRLSNSYYVNDQPVTFRIVTFEWELALSKNNIECFCKDSLIVTFQRGGWNCHLQTNVNWDRAPSKELLCFLSYSLISKKHWEIFPFPVILECSVILYLKNALLHFVHFSLPHFEDCLNQQDLF